MSGNAFAQNTIKFYIGETEKNLVKTIDPSLKSGAGNAMVIFRIGQWTIPDLEKSLATFLESSNDEAGEWLLISAHVEGDEVVAIGTSETMAVAKGKRGRYFGGRIWPDKLIDAASYKLASEQVSKSTWNVDMLSDATRKTLGAKSYGLVAPRRIPKEEYGQLRDLILTEVRTSRKAANLSKADAMVVFAIGSKNCGAACDAKTEVLTLLLESEK